MRIRRGAVWFGRPYPSWAFGRPYWRSEWGSILHRAVFECRVAMLGGKPQSAFGIGRPYWLGAFGRPYLQSEWTAFGGSYLQRVWREHHCGADRGG